MTVHILIKRGTGGLAIVGPPATAEELPWDVNEAFKQAFLDEWKNAYEWEKAQSNAGINQLSVLSAMAERLDGGAFGIATSFAEAYQQEAKRLIN